VIRHVQPNVVVLEICEARAHLLCESEETLLERAKNFSWSQLGDCIRDQGLIQGVVRALFFYQAKEIAEQLDILPGCELRAAFFEAKKVPNCIVQLGDRPLEITFKRVIASLSFWQKVKFACLMIFTSKSITSEEMEHLKTKDMLEEMIKKMSVTFPSMKQVIVDERDLFLTYRLQEAASRHNDIEFTVQAKKVNDSLASFLICERRLTTCRNELDNFKKVVLDKNVDAQKDQLRIWEDKLYNLEQQYSLKQQQMLNEEEKLSILKSRTNEDIFVPSVVVGVFGIGHISGIVKNWNKVKESDILPILE
jgi:pheromone shutdown protein TraB